MSTIPQPIRIDVDMWICMRNDPELPKAAIQRVHTPEGDRFLLYKWDVDPANRVLRGMYDSLDKANALVRFDPPQNAAPSAPPAAPPALSITESELKELAAMRGAGALIKR